MLIGAWHHCAKNVRKTEDYHNAEITLGGIDYNQLSSKTMQINHISGLYFIGKIVIQPADQVVIISNEYALLVKLPNKSFDK